MYRIPAPQASEGHATLEVSDRIDVIDMGDNRRLEVPIHARKIAEDLTADLGDYGVFVAAGDEPTMDEIAKARDHLVEVAKRLVFEGDQEWARSHNYRLLSDLHRRAVKRLGLEREWAYEPAAMSECPVCGERIKPGVALCKSCGAILDREKARAFGIVASGDGPRARRSPRHA
jgi:ribosomal protein L32